MGHIKVDGNGCGRFCAFMRISRHVSVGIRNTMPCSEKCEYKVSNQESGIKHSKPLEFERKFHVRDN